MRGNKTASVQGRGGEDLVQQDLHLNAKKFLEKQGLSLDDLNELFYKEGDAINPLLFEDLKTTNPMRGHSIAEENPKNEASIKR